MKTIGLIGGMSWESTLLYYRLLNQGVQRALGSLHSAEIVLYSVDFAPMETLQHQGDWTRAGELLATAARSVEAGGAEFLLLCTNTMHKLAGQIEDAVRIPLLHIADAAAERILQRGMKTVGLLGTAFTMQQEFYKGRMRERYGIEVRVPDARDRQSIHRIIYEELCSGIIREQSRTQYLRIIDALADDGAEAVVLGCTEIGLLVKQEETGVPLLDTTIIHAQKAVDHALSK